MLPTMLSAPLFRTCDGSEIEIEKLSLTFIIHHAENSDPEYMNLDIIPSLCRVMSAVL